MLDLLLSHHGVYVRGETVGAGRQPGAGSRSAGMRVSATNPPVEGGSSVRSSSTGAVSAGGSPGMDGGASAGGTDLQSPPSTAAGSKDASLSKDDRDQLALTTKTHPPEVQVCVCCGSEL